MNDHLFLCPRNLCRPYFYTIELFDNKFTCSIDSRLPPTENKDFPEGWDGPPTAEFRFDPFNPRPSMQTWYWFRRYTNATGGKVCEDGQAVPDCCGLLRELEWWYALARNTSNTEIA